MLVLFDNGTPRTLARYLIDNHTVTEARARGWDELENGGMRIVCRTVFTGERVRRSGPDESLSAGQDGQDTSRRWARQRLE
jgi:hypothetical protein